MSYPMDLDDYSDEILEKELARRQDFRFRGLCDYCQRKQTATRCGSDRHNTKAKESK